MDIDASKQLWPTPTAVCFRCKQPGHLKVDCPQRFDVRMMTVEERNEWAMSLLVEKDAAGEQSPEMSEEAEEAEEADFQ